MRLAQRLAVATAAAAGSLATGGEAQAHHGWSGYDASRLVTLTGTVQAASFEAPHGLLMLQADGKLWRVVLAPPSRMARRGFPPGSVAAGQRVTVEGYPHREDATEFRAQRIQLDGKTVELR
jgi:hypothetical protein